MRTLLHLNHPIPVDTPLGKGDAFILEADSEDYYWTVILEDSLALVTFSQDRLRARRNYTMRRGLPDKAMRQILRRKR